MSQIIKKAFIHTLGCRLNNADSALLNSRLIQSGYTLVKTLTDDVELIIINSCCVTAEAGRKSAQFVRKVRKTNPSSTIIFTGCAAVKGLALEDIPADYITEDKKSIINILENKKTENSKNDFKNHVVRFIVFSSL